MRRNLIARMTIVGAIIMMLPNADVSGQAKENGERIFFEREELRSIYEGVFYTIDRIYHYDFVGADQRADALVLQFPSEPEGYFYKAMILWKKFQIRHLPLSSTSDEVATYRQLLQNVVEICSSRLSLNSEDTRSMFYLGGAHGFLGRYEALMNNMFSAASQAKKGKEIFERILSKEPRLADANLALGLFNYYASMIPWYAKLFSWIFGITGDRDEGIRQLEIAVRQGALTKWEAAEVLSFAYINQERYREACTLLDPLSASFPENIEFHYGLALSYYKLKDWDSVLKHAGAVLETHTTARYGETSVVGYCFFVRARALHEKQKFPEAIVNYNELITLGSPTSLVTWSYLARGEAYQELGDGQRARADYDTVVIRGDNDQASERARKRMKELLRD